MMSAANDVAESDDDASTPAIAFTLAATFFVGSCFSSTVVHEVLGRRGLPATPLVYALVFSPISYAVVVFEKRIQQARHWPTIEKLWYPGIIGGGMVGPVIATVFFPASLGRSLPRGVPTAIALTTSISVPALAVARGLSQRRKSGGRP